MKAGSTWHPATDQLLGTDAYGTYTNDPQADATFSIPYVVDSVTEFLFSTGDESKWLVASKDEVVGGYYANEDRTIILSSTSSEIYTAKWYRRQGHSEDPWISLTDHGGAINTGDILYGGNAFSSNHANSILPHHNGANVWVRYANNESI